MDNPKEDITLQTMQESGVVFAERSVENDAGEPSSYLMNGRKLGVVCVAFMMSFALIALDQTILSTALATIVSHFHAVSDLTWIASAYFLPQAGLMLLFGRILAIAPAKVVYLLAIFIFEIGSLFCAVAPSVNFLIFGRAVAGVGAAALWVSIMAIIARITTMSQRPIVLGLFGGVFAVASIAGPLIGGAFSDHVSWRWCFWINLPCGGVAIAVVYFTLPSMSPPDFSDKGWRKWLQLDYIGAVLSVAAITLLLIPLQWGGNVRSWNDPLVIGLLVASVVLICLFLVWEHKQGSNAILPISILVDGNMPGACIQTLFVYIAFITPLLYQVEGHSATSSGISILPFMIAGVLTSFIAGATITATGHVWPFLVGPPLLASVAAGLLFAVTPSTRASAIIGYQILLGIGLGAVTQNGLIVAQAQYHNKPESVPQATSVITFITLIGSSLGLAISSAIFSSQLDKKLNAINNISSNSIQAVKISIQAIFILPKDQQTPIIAAYMAAVTSIFLMTVPSAALASISAFLISRGKIAIKGVVATG
ncbi:unnamed protein product [Somion occarium]|uniref:Major facilitator superfamily (MFS) profile domain-containing protein n=1 Tax=Somion occarium TaxID=3059160 RepID=A0ABP1DV66_9APHY